MILVTGGTGLTGSQIVFDLISNGESVRVFKRENSSLKNLERLFGTKNFPSALTFIDGDVTDGYSVEEALEGIEIVYHAAAFISFHKADRDKMMKINVEGTANMVNFSLKCGVKRFCHISSVAAIGREAGKIYIDEKSEWNNSDEDSNYALSKFRGEREVWRAMEEGLSAFIINPTIIIGAGDWKTGSTQMFNQIWKGMPFYSDGSTGFVDVRDVSKAAIQLMKSGVSGQRFILNSQNVPYRYVFDLIAEHLGKKKSRIKVTPLLAELGWRFEKIRSMIFGYKPMITKETANNGLMQWNYSNEKIRKEINIDFIPVEQSIAHTASLFVVDQRSGPEA